LNYKFPGAYAFYNTDLGKFTDGKCRDTRYSPYFAIVIDPFGPSVPPDGGYPGLSHYYRGLTNGSTGTVIEDCYFTNWVGGIITSPNGQTNNADLTSSDKIQFGNMKICVWDVRPRKNESYFQRDGLGCDSYLFRDGVYGKGEPATGISTIEHCGIYQSDSHNNQGGYFPLF
jgi:hypothetical protein